MASQAIVRVDGARQLRRTMRQADIDLQEMKDTHARVAALVTNKARANAPIVSGRLAATVRPGATKTSAIVRAGRKSVPYAGPIHWGWPARNIKAQPWLADTAKSSEPAWLAIYSQAVDQIIGRIEGAPA